MFWGDLQGMSLVEKIISYIVAPLLGVSIVREYFQNRTMNIGLITIPVGAPLFREIALSFGVYLVLAPLLFELC